MANGIWGIWQIKKYSNWYDYFMKGKITKKEFLNWYQTAGNYEPQTMNYNRSHKGE